MTAKGVSKPHKNWTTTEVKAAAALWKNGATTAAIARALNRSYGSVAVKVKADRTSFPPRNVEYGKTGPKTELKVRLTPFMHKKLIAEAAARNVSASNLIQKVLRDALLAGKPS